MAEEPENTPENDSPDLDMVPFFSSSSFDAELEAMNIHSILQAAGIPSAMVGASTLPNLEFQVQVPRENFEEARQVVEEATKAGPAAADEAELESENRAQ